jgi:flagellar assembly protein FliH
MMQIQRFSFDSLTDPIIRPAAASMAKDSTFLPQLEQEIVPPPPPSFTEEELEAAKREAYDNGFSLGKSEGKREADHELLQLTEQVRGEVALLNEGLDRMIAAHQAHLDNYRASLGHIIRACAERLAVEALRKDPIADIEPLVEECLQSLMGNPNVTLVVHSRLKVPLQDRFGVRVRVLGDDNLMPGDCKIQWANGQATRSIEAIWNKVEAIIDRHFTVEPQLQLDEALTPPEPDTAETRVIDTEGGNNG